MSSQSGIHLSVVLAFRNRAQIMEAWLGALMDAAPPDLAWELILVNSASTDDSVKVLAQLGKDPRFSKVKYLPLEKHQGLGNAMHEGLKKADGQVLALSRIESRWDPADVFRGLEALKHGGLNSRVLVRGRRKNRGPGPKRLIAGWLATALLWRDCLELDAQPKVFARSLLDFLGEPPQGPDYDLYLLFRAGQKGFKKMNLPVNIMTEKEAPQPRSWLKTIVLGALKLRISLEV